MAESYDYLVVGSGAAGSVIAARLAEAGAGSVCVLEAGGDNRRLLVDIPAGFVRNLNKPDLMWQFESVPTQHTGNRSVYLPQGRILGGSTSLNGLVYNRGQTHDFDHWASMGNTGWTYQELLPYFRKSETFHRDTQYRGSSGPLRINEPEQTHPLCDRFIDAVSDMTGVEKNADYNGNSQIGTGYYQRFIHRGKRENVADRFLKPQLQSNKVTIKTNSLVQRVLFNQKRATGVEVFRDEQCIVATAIWCW